ncbi:MAG: hypothetical protein EKK56_07830 [Flavobacteriaceae bacterium]|nr:MAG: hypothetical protein EKK56_07830 [Flavobacteriaceae bacterium]
MTIDLSKYLEKAKYEMRILDEECEILDSIKFANKSDFIYLLQSDFMDRIKETNFPNYESVILLELKTNKIIFEDNINKDEYIIDKDF